MVRIKIDVYINKKRVLKYGDLVVILGMGYPDKDLCVGTSDDRIYYIDDYQVEEE